MKKENIPGIPSNLALRLVSKRRYADLIELISPTEDVLKMYTHLILDAVSRIRELPTNQKLVEQLTDLLDDGRIYAKYHHSFTQALDVETSFRHDGGLEFSECMVHIISERHHLLDVIADAEKCANRSAA